MTEVFTLNGYRYCPCNNDEPSPCPACGASVEKGVCRLPSPPSDNCINIVLVDKDTGELI